jgi:hypothetical protein
MILQYKKHSPFIVNTTMGTRQGSYKLSVSSVSVAEILNLCVYYNLIILIFSYMHLSSEVIIKKTFSLSVEQGEIIMALCGPCIC